MINHICQSPAAPFSTGCLIVLGMGLAATPTAADRDLESVAGGMAAADAPGEQCEMFLDYWELDFFYFQRYHMADHGRGMGDPAETIAPEGEWLLRNILYADNGHELEPGFTVPHGIHDPCDPFKLE